MRKFLALSLLTCVLLGWQVPAYARRHHHHVNKEARAAQKRNQARAKQLKKEARHGKDRRLNGLSSNAHLATVKK